jgi:hypothetical protein
VARASVTRLLKRLDVILGELQFAFIAFVYGQSLDGFQQVSPCINVLIVFGLFPRFIACIDWGTTN